MGITSTAFNRIGHIILSTTLTICGAFLAVAPAGASDARVNSCPAPVGYQSFRNLNQSPNDVTVAGNLAYTADLHGLTIYDITDPSNPRKVGELLLPDKGMGIAVSGNTAFIADGNWGLQVVDVSDPAEPHSLAHGPLGTARNVAISGTLACVTGGGWGLRVFDVSDPAAPQLLGSYDTPGYSEGVAVSGHLAYVADGDTGLQIIDIADPAHLALAGVYDTTDSAQDVTVTGTTAYVADRRAGLQIIDVSDPAHPKSLGSHATPGWARGIAVSGHIAYVADDGKGVQIVDVTDPTNPRQLGSYDAVVDARGITVAGTTVYLASTYSDLFIIDAADPTNPKAFTVYPTSGFARRVALSRGIAFVADRQEGLQTIDVTDPLNPKFLGHHDTPGCSQDVAVAGDVALMADGASGLQLFDVSDPAHPAPLGSYDTPGYPNSLAVANGLTYLADGQTLQIIDTRDPAKPRFIGSYDTPNACRRVTVSGNTVYLGDDTPSIQIIDVTDPTSPQLLGSYGDLVEPEDIAVSGNVAYLADYHDLQILDVSNPANPTLLRRYTMSRPRSVAVSGNVLYATDLLYKLHIIDVSDPANPTAIETVTTRRMTEGVALDPSTGTVWVAEGPILEGIDVRCISPSCPSMTVTASPASITTGGSTATITVSVLDEGGQPEPGKILSASVTSGTISVLTDQGDGTYTGTFTSGATPGWVNIGISVDGAPCDANGQVHVTFAPNPALDGTLPWNLTMIAGAAHISGAEGTAWRSDAVLHNPGSREASVALFFLETGRDNTDARGTVVGVPAGHSMALNDLIAETFGRSSSGAVLLASDELLRVTARTYNDAASGTYGQFIPGLPLPDAILSNEKVVLSQLTANHGFRTNIGFANASASPLHVTVELHRDDGSLISSPGYTVPPYGFLQKTRIIGVEAPDAYAIVSSDTPGARFFTYASVVDNVSGDPILVLPVPATSGPILVPAAAHVHGAAGTNWKTDVEVLNPGTSAVDFSIEYLGRDRDNSSPPSASFSVKAGHSVRFGDILFDTFHVSGAGALRVKPASGKLIVTSRTFNDVPGGTYGQFIPGQPEANGEEIGLGARLLQLSQSASMDRGYRTNIGLTDVSGTSTRVRIALYDAAGHFLGTVDRTLRPYEFTQIDTIFGQVTAASVENGFAIVESTRGGTAFFAYASVVDNRSGDPINVPATR